MHATAFYEWTSQVSQHFRGDIRTELITCSANHFIYLKGKKKLSFVIQWFLLVEHIISQNARNAAVFSRWIQHLSQDVVTWKPKIDCWTGNFEQFCKFFLHKVLLLIASGFHMIFLNHAKWMIDRCNYRFKKFMILSRDRRTFMKSNEIFDYYRYFIKRWKHSIHRLKWWCHQSMNICTKKWCKIRQKDAVYVLKIGFVIYPHIKLATHSTDLYHMFWMVIRNCVSSKTWTGDIYTRGLF